jgi:hypothetical protein
MRKALSPPPDGPMTSHGDSEGADPMLLVTKRAKTPGNRAFVAGTPSAFGEGSGGAWSSARTKEEDHDGDPIVPAE